MKPSKHKMTVLSQIFKLIPQNLIPKLANEFGIDRQSRVFSPTSHVLALVFGQLTHALGLNDICDTLRNHCGLVSKIRDCVPPSRNGLSHANRNRDAGMAEKLFWEVLAHLNEISPNFRIQGRRYCALPRRFKRMIHVVDSTTIQLIANCLEAAWHHGASPMAQLRLAVAEHERAERSAIEQSAARLSIQLLSPTGLCFLPAFILIGIIPAIASFAA